jgi:ParB-like chromosome segregation protein Spo0J
MNKLQIEMWEISRIKPYDLNAKIHDAKQVEKIAKAITEFGWDQPIVVDKSGVIIKGHGRRLAAISLGYLKVPVLVRADLSEDQVRAARLADNRVAIGDIDSDLLKQELASLEFDLSDIFDKKELDFMTADLGEVSIDAFMKDIDEEVAAQAAEAASKIDETDSREVKIDKALGFKTIKGMDERHVARFMAQVEAETGKVGAEAFVGFVRGLMEADEAA